MRQPRRGPLRSRRPSPLARWSVNFSPEAASLSEGLRAAATCASLAAIATVLHDPSLSWAAVMAFWTCMVDPGGPNRVRARVLGLFTVLGTLVAVSCASVASLGLVPAAAVLMIVSFACSYLRVYGAEAGTLSNLLVVNAVVTIAHPIGDARTLLGFAGLCLGGCLWATTLSLTLWRIHPYAAARRAMSQVFQRLAAMAVGLADSVGHPAGAPAWTQNAGRDRRAVRQAIEEARRLTLQVMDGRGGQDSASTAARRLLGGLGAAEAEFAGLIALSDTLEREDSAEPARTARLAMLVASVMHRLARFLEATDGDPEPLRLATRRLEAAAERAPAPVRRLVRVLATEARRATEDDPTAELAQPATPKPLLQRLATPLRANFTWRSLQLRHAARLAVCVTGAYLLAQGFKIPYGYWMTTTVVLVVQPYLSASWVRAIERVIGGVLGGGLAAALGFAFRSQGELLFLIFPLAIACMAFRTVNYSLFVFFLTPLFVLILDLTHPGVREVTIAGVRALNTVIGGVIALAGCLLLWPGSEGDRLRDDLAEAVERNAKLACVALSSTGDDDAAVQTVRRQAGLASNKAEEARRRAGLEIWWRRRELHGAAEALAALRRLGGAAIAFWLQGRKDAEPVDVAVGAWCAQAAARLSGALRDGQPIPAPPDPPAGAGRAEPIVEEMQAVYRAAQSLA